MEEFRDRRLVTLADVAVSIRRAERYDVIHPVCGVGPEHAGFADGLNQIREVPVKGKARDHRVEEVVGERAGEGRGDAVGSAVEPDPAEALVHRGSEQQPYAFDASGVAANRAGVDIGPRRFDGGTISQRSAPNESQLKSPWAINSPRPIST